MHANRFRVGFWLPYLSRASAAQPVRHMHQYYDCLHAHASYMQDTGEVRVTVNADAIA
jgi:hypothetical protein